MSLASIIEILVLILFLIFLLPSISRRKLDFQRVSTIRKLEKKRSSRVIVLIHRQEVVSFLGIPFTKFIDIEDSESILRAIRLTPDSTPIDIILHTPGGLVLAAEQIAKALVRHEAKVTIFVPHYAMSGGTLIALAGDKIVMDHNAVLGPLDPQIGEYPAASILEIVSKKPIKSLEDKTLILADISKKAKEQVKIAIEEILKLNKVKYEKASKIAKFLTSGKWTHDYPIEFDEAKEIGLPVETGMPVEIYQLMELYPQPVNSRSSVAFIPLPYPSQPPKR